MSVVPVAGGEIATVVTFLEMHQDPHRPAPAAPASTLSLSRIECPDPEPYRRLFRSVGSRWLWFSRLLLDDRELSAIISDPRVELYVVLDKAGSDCGMLELDFREPGQCELAFVGLLPELAGLGHGRWLLAQAVRLAWREGVRRVHVHTCTLDHPAALAAYRRAGFVAFKRAVERFVDPRLAGILPVDCAPQVPLVGTVAGAASPPAS